MIWTKNDIFPIFSFLRPVSVDAHIIFMIEYKRKNPDAKSGAFDNKNYIKTTYSN